MQSQHAVAWGDPERLQARLDALLRADATLGRDVNALAQGALACLSKLLLVPFTELESQAATVAPGALWMHAGVATEGLWDAVLMLREVAASLSEMSDMQQREATGEAPPALLAMLSKPGDMPIEQFVSDAAWAVGILLQGEIDAFVARLPVLLASKQGWALVEGLQDHLFQLRRILGTLLAGLYGSLSPADSEARADPTDEREAACEVRTLVFSLREAILGIEQRLKMAPQAAWQALLQQAATALSGFIVGPGFTAMRARDKHMLTSQAAAFEQLLQLWSPLRAAPGKHAVESLARYLETLEVLNQRSVLVQHDRAKLTIVVRALEAAVQKPAAAARGDIGVGLAALSEAQWRDRELDALLALTLIPGGSLPLQEILARAKVVLAGLAPAGRPGA